MSDSFSEKNPEILVNSEKQEQQEQPQNNAAAAEDHACSLNPDDKCLEDNAPAEKESQGKMQSVFQQVRNQIRSQVGVRLPKSSILELVQKVKEMELAQVSVEADGEEVSGEEGKQVLKHERKNEICLKEEEEMCATFEEKLEARTKALKDEFQVQISGVRTELQAYTDQALKDLESKMQSWQANSQQQAQSKEQESKSPDKKQKPSPAPSLGSRRGRVLTRTMTTIIPKTCPPVVIGPRAKSETLSSFKCECSRFPPKDPVLSLLGNRACQSHKPLPPARPQMHQRKRSIQAKAKPGKWLIKIVFIHAAQMLLLLSVTFNLLYHCSTV